MRLHTLVFIVGLFIVAVACVLHVSRDAPDQRCRRHVSVVWLLLALGSVCALFAVFPESSTSGTLLGFKTAGAFAGFLLVWLVGMQWNLRALRSDEIERSLRDEVSTLRREVAALRRLSDSSVLPTSKATWVSKTRPDIRFTLITGRIEGARHYDVWVSPENTRMQPASIMDSSVSGAIRALGAVRDESGAVVRDDIGERLGELSIDGRSFEPGHIFLTTNAVLHQKYGVRCVVHVAAVHGYDGQGYKQVGNIDTCVCRVLEHCDQRSAGEDKVTSVVFPLLGVGSGEGDPLLTARTIIGTAFDYLDAHPSTVITDVALLALLEFEREAIERCLADFGMEPEQDRDPPDSLATTHPVR